MISNSSDTQIIPSSNPLNSLPLRFQQVQESVKLTTNLKDIKGLDVIKVPDNFELKESKIKGAGLGIFAKTNIKARTGLGEYMGVFVSIKEFNEFSPEQKEVGFDYGWEIHDFRGNKNRPKGFKLREQSTIGYVDAKDPTKSNYLRYINHPAKDLEENVTPYQLNGKIFYMTARDIKEGEELYVNYGPQYFN